jgi:hypothetical protein
MDPRLLRTKYAAQAATLAEQFRVAVQAFPVGLHQGEMTAPEGSTGGGVRALQHIRLVPMEGGGRTFVVGNANRAERVAELRSLDYVDRVSIERFGEPTGFDPHAYQAFIARAAQFLDLFGLTVTHSTHAEASRRPAPASGLSVLAVFALIMWSLGLLAIGAVLGVVAKEHGWVH